MVELLNCSATIWKEPSPIFSTFFFKLLAILVSQKKLITHGKFHSWKAFWLGDINENVPGYGNF